MSRRLRLLLSSAGRRVELLRCFRSAATELGLELEVLATDLRPEWSAACQAADAAIPVPPCAAPDYADTLLELCARRGVDLLVPTIDTELEVLSAARGRFQGVGTEIVVSAPELVAIARDKLDTALFLAEHGIPAPRTATPADVVAEPEAWAWPVIVKPRHGSAGKNVRILASPAELAAFAADEPLIVQDLLRGAEYTVNLYFDHAGRLRTAIPHWRHQVRAGEVEKGVTRRVPSLAEIATRLGAALPGPRGPLCFQAIIDPEGRACVFEINARFGGGYPLAHQAGAEFARWLLEERAGLPCSAHDAWRQDIIMLRYDAAIFKGPCGA